MADTSLKSHPLIIVAATAVIITCLLAIGVLTGIVPSPLNRDRGVLPQGATTSQSQIAVAPKAPAVAPAPRREEPSRERLSKRQPGEPVGATPSTAPTQTVAPAPTVAAAPAPTYSPPPPRVAAVCNHCGTVTSVRVVKQQSDASMIGPAAGAAVGGLIGNQIGSGSGNKIATIAGAAIGAGEGTEVERRYKATTSYIVGVRLNDGTTRSFTYQSAPGYQQGDKVKVVNGQLVRDS